ncbi:hypothetical protein D3C81_941070 [compost metagenome]
MGDALWIVQHEPRFGLFRQVESVARDVGIRRVQQRQVISVTGSDVARQILLERHHAVVEGLGQPHQRHALLGQSPEIDGLPTTRTAHGDGDVLAPRLHGFQIPKPQHPQPPAEITVAIGARRTVVLADRQVDLLAGTLQFIGDLHTGRTGTDHQHTALGQLLRVEILGRVNLRDRAVCRRNRRDDRTLERTGRRHHAIGLNHAFGGFDGEAWTITVAYDFFDFHTGTNRRFEFLGVGFEVSRHLIF